MSSLRLALKQSLQETGHLVKDKKKKKSGGSSNSGGKGKKQRPLGEAPRKRGRPRKTPVPDEDGEGDEHAEYQSDNDNNSYSNSQMDPSDNNGASFKGADDRRSDREGDNGDNGRHSQHSDDQSGSENEFSYDSDEEEDDSEEEEGEENEKEGGGEEPANDREKHNEEPKASNVETEKVESPSERPKKTADENAEEQTLKLKGSEESQASMEDGGSDQEELHQEQLQRAANKIQAQWKKKHGISPSDNSKQRGETARERKEATNENEKTSSPGPPETESAPIVEKKKKKKKENSSSKSQTVPPPEPEVLEWSRNLSEKKCRKHIASGLRVKVRFAAKVKREGKVVKKKIWYGGRVSAVSKEGSKIRIKYDDGTSEISKFPDKDVVVDDTFNGQHTVVADKFIPPSYHEEEVAPMEEDEEDGEVVEDKEAAVVGSKSSEHQPRSPEKLESSEPPSNVSAPPGSLDGEKELVSTPPAEKVSTDHPSSKSDATSTEQKKDNSSEIDKEVQPVEDLSVPAPEPEMSPVEKVKPSTKEEIDREEIFEPDASEGAASEDIVRQDEKDESKEELSTNKPEIEKTSVDKGNIPSEMVETVSAETPPVKPANSIVASDSPTKQQDLDTSKGKKEDASAEENPEEHIASKPASPKALMSESPNKDADEEEPAKSSKVAVSPEEKQKVPKDPVNEKNKPESPATPKPSLTIRISNIKTDQGNSAEKTTPKTPKMAETDSEEELFADTPVTERRVKSIQLKKKSKRKRESNESPSEEAPSKKRIILKQLQEGKKVDEEEPDLALPQPNDGPTSKKVDSFDDDASIAKKGEQEEENKTKISEPAASLRNPEVDAEAPPMLPTLKGKKDRANSPVPKGRKSPTPRSRSPVNAGEAKTSTMSARPDDLPEDSEEKDLHYEKTNDEENDSLSPKGQLDSKTSAFSRKRAGKELENEPPEMPALDAIPEAGSEAENVQQSKESPDSLPAIRAGRRAAQQAKEKITTKQDEKVPESSKKKKKRKRKEGEDEADHSDGSVDDRQWVQCESCNKWRILPSNVKISSLPKHWYCHLNSYDPKRASCSAPEQTAKQAAKEWKRARKRAKQQRLAELAATEAENDKDEATKESKKDITPVNSPRPPKGAKKEKQESKRVSPGNLDSREASLGQENPKNDKKGKKVKTQNELADVPAAPVTGDAEAPKKPGRKRGRPARNQSQKESDDGDNVEWVQCEKCEKWRKLPPHISADELPDTWYCQLNDWNPATAHCSAPEDKADATHHEVGNFSGMFGAAGKYTYRSLIFGTGKKHGRPMSERARAAESLFMRPIDGVENPYPTVMYSKSSCFVPRTSNFNKASTTEEEEPGIFDVLSNSELWAELRTVGQPMQVRSSKAGGSYPKFLCFENLPEDIKEAMREIVLRSLGVGTLTGDEVIRHVQFYPWEQMSRDLVSIREYFNADIIVNTLLALVRDGVVEMTSLRDYNVPIAQWVPKYRKVRSRRAMEIEESIKASRYMKISKPWKQRDDSSEWTTGGAAFS